MTQIRKILKCLHVGWSIRKIVKMTGIARNTVRTYQRRVDKHPLALGELLELDDEHLSQIVLEVERGSSIKDDLLDRMPYFEEELKKVGVTRKQLWEEYREEVTQGYGYSQFCDHLHRWRKAHQVVMHFSHSPGEIMEADFAGKKLSYVDTSTGEVIDCATLVTVLPFSNLIFCKVLASQKQEEFIDGLACALEYYEGIAKAVKVDNLRSAVVRSDRYEPTFTQLMDEFAQHYQTTAIAARVGKPRDKSSVENSVQIVYQKIYAKLRDKIFTSINEINHAIIPLLHELNEAQMQNKDYSRRSLFEECERSTLQQLPASRFRVRKTASYKVQKNYHIMLGEDRHMYSVPHHLVGQQVTVRYCFKLVEIYHKHSRVAAHERIRTKYEYSTIQEHMPPNHQHVHKLRGWTAVDFEDRARKIGVYTLKATQLILNRQFFIEQNFTSCLGLQKLAKKYGNDRLELACKRAINHGVTPSYTMIKKILKRRLDSEDIQSQVNFSTPNHSNIRGPQSYH